MDIITFDHRRLFHGIAFHLRERHSGPGRRLNAIRPHSLGRLARRLERQEATAAVRRADWQSWSDAERLEWLMTMSNTRVVCSGDGRVSELVDAKCASVRLPARTVDSQRVAGRPRPRSDR